MGCSCSAPVNNSESFNVQICGTEKRCAAGEQRGNENSAAKKIPVLSCEGACIKGEIARLIANIISKRDGYARGCHGELLTVPDSALAQWIKNAPKTVIIDGCGLKCHTRVFENILPKSALISVDALSYHKSYSDKFDIDSVSQKEREEIAKATAEKIMIDLTDNNKHDTICEKKSVECKGCLSLEEDSLVSLGAAIGANCVPCTVYYLKQCNMSTLGEAKIKAAIEAALKVKNTPAEHISSVISKALNGKDDSGVTAENEHSTNKCTCG
jgi:alkylhydroperoxidase/carboxymuconolactone decarboxylase family protein YurZ